MKAFYDNEADALQIHFTEPPRAGWAEDVDGDARDACFVEIDDTEEKVGVELLWASEHLEFLDLAAEQYGLPLPALKAVTAAAMAAPMRYVTVEVEAAVAA
jgi:uncharacterized protein YuzE